MAVASQFLRSSVFAAEGDPALPVVPPAKIYRVFAGRTSDSYLTQPTEQIEKFNQYFAGLEKKFPRRAVPRRRSRSARPKWRRLPRN